MAWDKATRDIFRELNKKGPQGRGKTKMFGSMLAQASANDKKNKKKIGKKGY
jgi:hypothetical protein